MFLKLTLKLEKFIEGIEISVGLKSIPDKTTGHRREMANHLQTEGMKLAGSYGTGIITSEEWDRIITCAKNITKNRAERHLALDKLLSFAKNSGKTTLYLINKERFCVQLLIRILDPNKIDQGLFGMCGPTTIIASIIKRKPDTYTEAAIALVTTGISAGTFATTLKVPAVYKAYDIHTAKCPEVDWVFLLALKDSDFWAQMLINPGSFGSSTLNDLYSMYEKSGLFTSLVLVDPAGGVQKSQGALVVNGVDKKQRFDHAGVLAADKTVSVILFMPGDLCKTQMNIHPNTYHLFKPNHFVILKKMVVDRSWGFPMYVKLQISTWTMRMITDNIPLSLIYETYGGYIAAKL